MPKAFVYTHIRGFDEEVLRGCIPQGHVILIRGASGTMKSSLAYYILYHNALGGLPGLYVTLEQTAGSLLEHVAAPGPKATAVSDALPILELRRKRKFELLAIDSWDALELILDFRDPRAETFGFFEWLRDLGVTSLLISEEPELQAPSTGLEEEFLADGIVLVRLQPVTETAYQRRVQCVKMRSVNQDSDDHTLLFENGRFEVARAIG